MNKLTMTLVTLCASMLFVGAPQDTQAGQPMVRGGHAVKHAGHALKKHAGHLSLHRNSHFLRRSGPPLSRGHGFGHGSYGLGGFGYDPVGIGYGVAGYGVAGVGLAGAGLSGAAFGLNGFDVPDGLSLYRRRMIPVPPYFSLHPPVYYSAPVARSYGLSPFPYPGDVPSPAVEQVQQPAVVDNPYAAPIEENVEEEKPKPTEDSVAHVAPEMILNPYVDRTVHDDEIHVAKTTD